MKLNKQGTYLVYVYRLLLRLYGLHLDVLTELYRLLLCLHCRFPSDSSKIMYSSNQIHIYAKGQDALTRLLFAQSIVQDIRPK